MDINFIKENYKKFDNSKIETIALKEANTLKPEIVEILKAEVQRRNLNSNLINCIDSQIKELTEKDLIEYSELLRKHKCPNCNSKTNHINVSITGRVISVLIFTSYKKSLKVACPNCLDEMHNNANMVSAVAGWWGIPWGPINTIRSFIFNAKMKKNNRLEASDLYKSFILSNIGVLEQSKTEPEKLTNYLKKLNE
ncbi:hypothetical protein ACG2LH_15550 [Zhouia sp. PK063]|uniref:hypothetical protein n=1 Tax=Zhouia sp. PK063 TaxID=3373602 RepID=UPI00379D1BB4